MKLRAGIPDMSCSGYRIVTRADVTRPAARLRALDARSLPDTLSQPLSAPPPQ